MNRQASTGGAVYVEFLIVFLPLLTMFLCLVQIALLFAVRIVVAHAAVNAARTAAVVIGDESSRYDNEVPHVLTENGKRRRAIENAALLTLAPFIIDGTVIDLRVEFPPSDTPDGKNQVYPITYTPMNRSTIAKIRVRVVAVALCKIGLANAIACSGILDLTTHGAIALGAPSKLMRAEAVFPYQGAGYKYR